MSAASGMSLQAGQRVINREGLEAIGTEVGLENLQLLDSQLGKREKLDRLLAPDLLVSRRAAPGPRVQANS